MLFAGIPWESINGYEITTFREDFGLLESN